MADVDDNHDKLATINSINNTITSYPIGPAPFEFSFEGFPLKGIALKIIKRVCKPTIKPRIMVRDFLQRPCGLIDKF